MERTHKITNLQRTGGALRRHTSGSFSVSTVWRDVQEDAQTYDEPLGKRSQAWIVETVHLLEYHGLLELRDSGKLCMVPKLRAIVKESQNKAEKLQFQTAHAELDFVRKRILKHIGRLPYVKKRELHREHMALQKQFRDRPAQQRIDRANSAPSVLHVDASVGVSVPEPPAHQESGATPARNTQHLDSDTGGSHQAYPTPSSDLRGTASQVVPAAPESPTPVSRMHSQDDQFFDMHPEDDGATNEPSAAPAAEERAQPTRTPAEAQLEQKDAELAALRAECDKAVEERDVWKARRDELRNGLSMEQYYVRFVEAELEARERKMRELGDALEVYEAQLDDIVSIASMRRPVVQDGQDRRGAGCLIM